MAELVLTKLVEVDMVGAALDVAAFVVAELVLAAFVVAEMVGAT